MVEQTGLESLCKVGNTVHELQTLLHEAMNAELSQEDLEQREKILVQKFSSTSQVKLLMEFIGLNQRLEMLAES
jgi:ribonuclease HIII